MFSLNNKLIFIYTHPRVNMHMHRGTSIFRVSVTASQPRTTLTTQKYAFLFSHLPGCWESEKQRAEKFREHSCSQKVFAGALGELEEMF